MCFANVAAAKDAAENEKFTKERARGRIDGPSPSLSAAILSTDEGPCVYETADRLDGFLWV